MSTLGIALGFLKRPGKLCSVLSFMLLVLVLSLPSVTALETICKDNIDNDGDSKIDSLDSDCVGKSCSSITTSKIWVWSHLTGENQQQAPPAAADGKRRIGCCTSTDCAFPGVVPSPGGLCQILGRESGSSVCGSGNDWDVCSKSTLNQMSDDGVLQCRLLPDKTFGWVKPEICTNGNDEDKDNKIDCADSECVGKAGNTDGNLCEKTETNCADGFDNDRDDKIDSIDTNCVSQSCSTTDSAKVWVWSHFAGEDQTQPLTGRVACCAQGECVVSGSCKIVDAIHTSTNPVYNCGDSNDWDGCATSTISHNNKQTDDLSDSKKHFCDSTGWKTCGTAAFPEGSTQSQYTCSQGLWRRELCSDSIDNDNDGLNNCADPNCVGQTGDDEGHLCQAEETSCIDGFDNDGDNLIDKLDANCIGQPCSDTAGDTRVWIWSQVLGKNLKFKGCCNQGTCTGLAAGQCFSAGLLNPVKQGGSKLYCQADSNWATCGGTNPSKLVGDLSEDEHYYCGSTADGITWIECTSSTENSVLGTKRCQDGVWREIEICTDGFDNNDADTLTDCADDECVGKPADDDHSCEQPEISCTDGFDNDGDSRTDGSDKNCERATCDTDKIWVWSHVADEDQANQPPPNRVGCCAEDECAIPENAEENALITCQTAGSLWPFNLKYNCGAGNDWDGCAALTDNHNNKQPGELSDNQQHLCDDNGWKTCGFDYSNDMFSPVGDYVCFQDKWRSCTSVPNDLVGWWRGEGTVESTRGGLTSTGAGEITYSTPGKVGQAINFDGSNDVITVTDSSALDITGAVTIEGWILPTALAAKPIFTKWTSTGGSKGYLLSLTGTSATTAKIQFKINGVSLTSTGLYTAGQFQHIAAVYVPGTSGASMRIYINGQLAGEKTSSVPASITVNNENLLIGKTSTVFFKGKMDELSLYNRALSADEINTIYLAAGKGKCLQEFCNDEIDNDGDTFNNCADSGCVGQPADNAGHLCEQTEASCFDEFDNDGDGFPDCRDSHCDGQSDTFGQACQFTGETECADGDDNDHNDFTDCADSNCVGQDGDQTASGKQECQPAAEMACTDTFDNDGDGLTDRFDESCEGTTCAAGKVWVWSHVADEEQANPPPADRVGCCTAGECVIEATCQTAGSLWLSNSRYNCGADSDWDGCITDFDVHNNKQPIGELSDNRQHLCASDGWKTCGLAPFPDDTLSPVGDYVCFQNQWRSCISVPDDLVGWWRGENSIESTRGGLTSTEAGGITFIAGKVGQAINFDGSNDVITVTDSTVLDITGAVTIEGWILPTALAAKPIFTKWTSTGGSKGYLLSLAGTTAATAKINFKINGVTLTSTGLYTAGQFQHIAAVYVPGASGASMRIYINGQLAGEKTSSVPASITVNNENLLIGKTSTVFFKGKMDELSLYNRALSADEINTIYLAAGKGKCLQEFCNDEIDNDGDTFNNCADSGCVGQPADNAGHLCEQTEASCFDEFDNDGDGFTDRLDAQCQGAVCTAGSEEETVLVWSHLPGEAKDSPPPVQRIGCCLPANCRFADSCWQYGQPLTGNPQLLCSDDNAVAACDLNSVGVRNLQYVCKRDDAGQVTWVEAAGDSDGDEVDDTLELPECLGTPKGAKIFKTGKFIGCLEGDINSNNKVDAGDITPFIIQYREQTGKTEVVSKADITRDGEVNGGDITPFIIRYRLFQELPKG